MLILLPGTDPDRSLNPTQQKLIEKYLFADSFFEMGVLKLNSSKTSALRPSHAKLLYVFISSADSLVYLKWFIRNVSGI